MLLVALVAVYSTVGGLRGVVRTDLVQFALGLLGSVWLAVVAWSRAGGREGVREGLAASYATRAPELLQFLPSATDGWGGAIGLGAFGLGAYLLVQSYANVPADGGGYLQQRLSAARSEDDAQKAALLFVVLQYGVRIWPWLMVAFAALVLVPVGAEPSALGPELGALVADDREMAYPALMLTLLPPGVLGLLIVSLLAAFMSTVDTHFNWGASYAVSDVALRVWPAMTPRTQVRVARGAVLAFSVAAVFVAFHIERIEQAWQWVAALGAALGLPTMLRWFWWRVTAAAELAGAVIGLATAGVLLAVNAGSYEGRLIAISASSALATLLVIVVGPRPEPSSVRAFVQLVRPLGVWPREPDSPARTGLPGAIARTVLLIAVMVLVLRAGSWWLLA
jgi:Na+/proline symporter